MRATSTICPLCLRERLPEQVVENDCCLDAFDCAAAVRKARDRLAAFIEEMHPGATVYRASGMVIT